MIGSDDATQFLGKTWIYRVQTLFFGLFAAVTLIVGPLCLTGLHKKVDGTPATEAGVGLTAMSFPFCLVFALALYNLRARRRPLIRLCREGIEVVQVGASSLDRIPMIPGLIRVAWSIVSTQGFRSRVVRIPWRSFRGAHVGGPPMARRLTINAEVSTEAAATLPAGSHVSNRVVFPEVAFVTPLDRIAEAIESASKTPARLRHLGSWSIAETALTRA